MSFALLPRWFHVRLSSLLVSTSPVAMRITSSSLSKTHAFSGGEAGASPGQKGKPVCFCRFPHAVRLPWKHFRWSDRRAARYHR